MSETDILFLLLAVLLKQSKPSMDHRILKAFHLGNLHINTRKTSYTLPGILHCQVGFLNTTIERATYMFVAHQAFSFLSKALLPPPQDRPQREHNGKLNDTSPEAEDFPLRYLWKNKHLVLAFGASALHFYLSQHRWADLTTRFNKIIDLEADYGVGNLPDWATRTYGRKVPVPAWWRLHLDTAGTIAAVLLGMVVVKYGAKAVYRFPELLRAGAGRAKQAIRATQEIVGAVRRATAASEESTAGDKLTCSNQRCTCQPGGFGVAAGEGPSRGVRLVPAAVPTIPRPVRRHSVSSVQDWIDSVP